MANLLKWVRDRGDDIQGLYHQVNTFDGGRTYDTNRRNVNPGTPQTARRPTPVFRDRSGGGLRVDNTPNQQTVTVEPPKRFRPPVKVDNTPDRRDIKLPDGRMLNDTITPQQVAERAINRGLDLGQSWEDISRETKIPVEAIKQYSESTRPNYGITMQRPDQSIGNKFRDLLDANTEADEFRRFQANQEVGADLVPVVSEDPGNVISNTVGAIPRMLNTAGAQVPQAFYTAQGQLAVAEQSAAQSAYADAIASGDPVAVEEAKLRMANAAQRVEDILIMQDASAANFKDNSGGLFNAGTIYNEEDAKTGGSEAVKKVIANQIEGMADVASLGLTSVTGKQIAKQGLKDTLKTGRKVIAKNAGVNTVQGGADAARRGGDAKAVLASALLAGTAGTVTDLALAGAGAGAIKAKPAVKKATTKSVKAVSNTTKKGVKAVKEASEKSSAELAEATRLSELRKQYQKAFDKETNPTRRRQINKALAELNRNPALQKQGGYIRVGSDRKKGNISKIAKKYKTYEEFEDAINVNYRDSYNGDKSPIADELSKEYAGYGFHGTTATDEILKGGYKKGYYPDTWNAGTYFADTPDVAIEYRAQNRSKGGSKSGILMSNLDDLKVKRLDSEVFYGINKGNYEYEELVSKLKKQGYDGIDAEMGGRGETLIWNPEKIKTTKTLEKVYDESKVKNKKVDSSSKKSEGGYVDPGAIIDDTKKAVKNTKDKITGKKKVDTVPYPDPRSKAETDANTRWERQNAEKQQTFKSPRQPLTVKTNKKVKQSKFATKTVQRSQEVSEKLKKQVQKADNDYTVVHNKDQIEASEKFVKKNNIRAAVTDVKERLTGKEVDSQTVSDSIAVAKKLDAKGTKASLLEATEIYEKLGEQLTKSGQAIQAASLLNNRTPQGMKYYAMNTLRKSGVKLDDVKSKQLNKLIADVKKAKPDTYEAGLARYRVAEFVEKNVPSGNTSKAIQLWKAGLLTSPRTTAGNIAANTAETVYTKGYADPVANALDAMFSVFTGKRSRSLTYKGLGSGTGEGIVKGVKYFKTGYDPRNPAQKFDVRNIHYSDTKLGKAAELYTQGVFRLMGAQDQPFYYANLRNSIYDQAITEAKNKKLKGAAKKNFIKKSVEQPTEEIMQLADKEARYAVFQNETALGKAASRIKSMDGAAGDVAEFVMPFSGVPSSIATRIIERTPIGTATEIVKQIRSKKFNQRRMTKAIAEGTAIVPLIGAGRALAEAGNMTLSYPQDKKERELWEADGRQPYSIKVGDTWLSLNYFQPAGTIIASGAEYQKALDEGKTSSEALSVATAGAGQALTEQSFLKGVSGATNAVVDPQRAGERFVDSTVGSVVPNFIRATATATDDKQRQVNTLPDRFKSAVPGLRQTLDPKRDLFGRDVERRTTAAGTLLNPFRPSDSKNKNDPVTAEIRRLQNEDQGVIPTQFKRTTFQTGDDKDNEELRLTDKQVQDWNAEIGKAVQKEWDKTIKSNEYKNLSDEEKKDVLSDINSDVYGALKKRLAVEEGIYEQGSDKTKLTTRERRYLEGRENDYFAKDASERTPTEEYEAAKTKLKEDRGDLNPIELQKREREIQRLGVQKDYDEVVVDLYALSKDGALEFAENSEDGEKLMKQAIAYGDALVEAGLEDKNKFRDKYGNLSTKRKSKSSGSKKKKPWQAPGDKISRTGKLVDTRALIASAGSNIKARDIRRTF